jgi:hypothetical protein
MVRAAKYTSNNFENRQVCKRHLGDGVHHFLHSHQIKRHTVSALVGKLEACGVLGAMDVAWGRSFKLPDRSQFIVLDPIWCTMVGQSSATFPVREMHLDGAQSSHAHSASSSEHAAHFNLLVARRSRKVAAMT